MDGMVEIDTDFSPRVPGSLAGLYRIFEKLTQKLRGRTIAA
jgi:hypothetical protein